MVSRGTDYPPMKSGDWFFIVTIVIGFVGFFALVTWLLP